jgi:hypothetical protein
MDDPELQIVSPDDENKPMPKFLIAAGVMIVIGVAVFLLNPRKTAELSVQKVALFAPHTVMNATEGGGQVVGTAPSSEDDLYVVATLKIEDKLRLPIFVDSYTATLVTSSGTSLDATIVAGPLLPKVGETFPQLLPLVNPPAATPIKFDDAIQPGETKVGSVVLLFPQASEQVWREKKSATLTLTLSHDAAPLTVALP